MKVLTLEEMTGLRGPGICICKRNQSGLHRNQIMASNWIRFCVRLLVCWFLTVSTADSPPWDPEAKAPGTPRHLGVSALPTQSWEGFLSHVCLTSLSLLDEGQQRKEENSGMNPTRDMALKRKKERRRLHTKACAWSMGYGRLLRPVALAATGSAD